MTYVVAEFIYAFIFFISASTLAVPFVYDFNNK
jgi:hypothetical protein